MMINVEMISMYTYACLSLFPVITVKMCRRTITLSAAFHFWPQIARDSLNLCFTTWNMRHEWTRPSADARLVSGKEQTAKFQQVREVCAQKLSRVFALWCKIIHRQCAESWGKSCESSFWATQPQNYHGDKPRKSPETHSKQKGLK